MLNFYSRPCERGDTEDMLNGIEGINFYSRPCERGDEL